MMITKIEKLKIDIEKAKIKLIKEQAKIVILEQKIIIAEQDDLLKKLEEKITTVETQQVDDDSSLSCTEIASSYVQRYQDNKALQDTTVETVETVETKQVDPIFDLQHDNINYDLFMSKLMSFIDKNRDFCDPADVAEQASYQRILQYFDNQYLTVEILDKAMSSSAKLSHIAYALDDLITTVSIT